MIKFFRHIRKQLLGENRLSKYLIYALGEIILVVIGILLALKINNYNTELNNQKLVKNQLENVALEVGRNIKLLDKTIEKSESIITASRQIANTIVSQNSISEEQLSEWFGAAFAPVLNYQPNTSLLNEMINTGSLRDLKNDQLKGMLLEIQSQISELKNQEKLHAEDQQTCADYLLEHGDFKLMMDQTKASSEFLKVAPSKEYQGNLKLLESKEFENKLILFMASGIGLKEGNYIPFKASLETIYQTINQEE